MKINRSNFEEIIVDYFDGNLSPLDVEELMRFLAENSDLEALFHNYDPEVVLNPAPAIYPQKHALKRGFITSDNADYYLAAYVEGDLDLNESALVEQFAQHNPGFARQLHWMQSARLKPDKSIEYPAKDSLRKVVVVPLRSRMLRWTAAAAIFAALVASAVLYLDVSSPETSELISLQNSEPALSEDVGTTTQSANQTLLAERTEILASEVQSPEFSMVSTSDVPAGLYSISVPQISADRLESLPAVLVYGNHDFRAQIQIRNMQPSTQTPGQEYPEEPLLADGNLSGMIQSYSAEIAEDLRRIEERLSQNRPPSLLGLAGASLLGINQFLGSPVRVHSKIDENGQTLSVSFGSNLEFSLRTR